MQTFCSASELFASNCPIAQRGILQKKGQRQTWSARAQVCFMCLLARKYLGRPRSTGRQQKKHSFDRRVLGGVNEFQSGYREGIRDSLIGGDCRIYMRAIVNGMCQYWYTCWKFNLSKLIPFVLIQILPCSF